MRKNNSHRLLWTLALCFVAFLGQAQPGDPGPDPDPNNINNPIPFDGGLSLVIAAGVAYAAKKGVDKRKAAKAKSFDV